jgi:hypothetical protein
MKFKPTLHVDAKETEILARALQMYLSHLNNRYHAKDFNPLNKQSFESHRNKVINMLKVIEAMERAPKFVISEATEFDETDVVKTQ